MLLAQKDRATQQILHLTQQLAQRDLTIQQLNAQLAATSNHSHASDTSDAFASLLAKYETALTQAQHYKDRAKHFKAHAQQLHDRLRDIENRQPAAAVLSTDPHVTLLRQQARDWKDRAEVAERRAAGLEMRVRDVGVMREVVSLLRQRVSVLQGELRLIRGEVPVLVSETVVRVQGEVQRVVGDIARRLAAQREENRSLEQELLSLRHRMNSRYESLLLEHHRHSRQYAALLAEEEDAHVLKPTSLSPLPLPLAYTSDTLRPTHHRTTTSHSQPTPNSSDTAASSSNNTQRSSSQPRDSQLPDKANVRASASKLHTMNGVSGRTRQSLFTDNESDSADDDRASAVCYSTHNGGE